jgi:iron(III) transport system ATP-binding protein
VAELILERLNKVFGEQAVVRDLSLTIPEGAFTALLGPSGCGKTTTLRILAGLEHLSSGRLLLGDRLLADSRVHMPPETRDMGMVFQSYALWPHMTVAENVGYPLKLRKVNGAARQKRVMEALDVVELGAYAGRSPQELSGGQRQRVALARCLVSEPEVVLLDEPLANLDRHLRATMEQTFREFHRRTGATFVYVTHDQAEAMALASHIAVMHQGELMQWGRRRRSISIHKMPGWRGLSVKAAFCRWQPSIRKHNWIACNCMTVLPPTIHNRASRCWFARSMSW